MSYCVYILYSVTLDRFYIGETSNLDIRLKFHKDAASHKFTAKAKDWKLFLKIDCLDRKHARLVEGHIKKMKSRIYITNLKRYPEMIEKLQSRYQG